MVVVRVRVPYVHPIVCCTVKRAVRLLPSALLLVFVLSLILVTLVQIAVIHSHRRSLYLQRKTPSTSKPSTPGQTSKGSPMSHFHAWSAHRAKESQKKPNNTYVGAKPRPNALQVEALLDRNAPSVDGNIHILMGYANAARIRSIVLAWDSVNATSSDSGKPVANAGVSEPRVNGSWQLVTDVYDGRVLWNKKRRRARNEKMPPTLPLCPEVPPGLVGRIQVDLDLHPSARLKGVPSRGPGRGSAPLWSPPHCTARHRVAVVVPYRDRRPHLLILLNYLHPILQRQLLNYRIYVVEQYGNDTFNKGVLMNAAVREAFKDSDFHCFVFHDVDLIPEDDRNMYSCPPSPRHMSVAIDKFNYTLPYQLLVGGVFAIKVEHFLKVNGFSNLYWGWGGEDDDMAYRIKHKKLKIIRPPASVARYTMIKHIHRPESPNNIRMALVRMAWYRMNRDGLSTAKYRVVHKRHLPLYTHLLVDIGHNHKWHFSGTQKLIINL
ncbi:beta-1,4-N-acetylgalactosaminyltransferase bre-4-like [Ornithodoros turicata]|uniref:beta-1,4-N-acetylgalactosaminyltransferase bre-4-like n=1 Tax=Ornithodoros turicata TaxID=34597 RepID=UPI003139B965